MSALGIENAKNKKEPLKTALFPKSRSNLWEYIFDLKNRYNQGAQPQKPLGAT